MPGKKVSEKQLAANRRNAQKSTGPRTPEGKQRSSRNAITHGLTAAHSVIELEDRAEFEEFRAELIAEHQPVGTQELLLVTQIANGFWRIKRIQQATVAEFDRSFDECESATTGMTIANTFIKNAYSFDILRRYDVTANSVYFRALAALDKLQSRRLRRERVATEDGFASQSATAGLFSTGGGPHSVVALLSSESPDLQDPTSPADPLPAWNEDREGGHPASPEQQLAAENGFVSQSATLPAAGAQNPTEPPARQAKLEVLPPQDQECRIPSSTCIATPTTPSSTEPVKSSA